MSDYNNRVRQWAEEAARAYNEIGREINHNYYNQSPLDKLEKPPRILICGINPGSCNDNFCDHNADDIMKGNQVWNLNQWSNLKKFGFTTEILSECVLTNFTMFASKSAKEIEGLVYSTISITKKMFEVIAPNVIILLSGEKGFKLLKKYGNETFGEKFCEPEYVLQIPKNKILVGRIGGIPTLGIPHPNYCPNPKSIANVVKVFLEGERDISRLNNAYMSSIISVDIQTLSEIQKNKNASNNVIKGDTIQFRDIICKSLDAYGVTRWKNDPKSKRFCINDFLQLTATTCENGYIAIRLKEHPSGMNYTTSVENSKIKDIIKINGWTITQHWIGRKNFNEFESPEECFESIKKLINEISSINE